MPGAYSIADYAADVIAFIEKNFTEPVDLLGHSLGAHVSLVVANAIPKHIRSVIAFGPDPWPCWKQMFSMPTFCPIPVWDMIRKL